MLKTIEASDLGIVNRLLAVDLRVSIWTARRKLTPQDLGDAELPPDDLASLGSKKICDPESLRIFNTLKARAIGVLNLYGIEFMSGWAIPEYRAAEVHQKLAEIEREFNEAKEDFMNNYSRNVQGWINQHVEWASIIEDSVVSAEYVRSRIGFRSRIYSVGMPGVSGDCADMLSEGFQEEVAGFGRALFDDVKRAATEAWKNSFKGQEKISHKALSPIRKIYDKLVSFSFVDPNVLPLTEIIQAALDSLPKRGYIEGLPLIQFQGLVSLLRDTEALIDLAERRMSGLATEDILAGFIPAEMLQATEPEEDQPSAEDEYSLPMAAVTLPVQAAQAPIAAPGPVQQAQAPAVQFSHPSLLDYSATVLPQPTPQSVMPAVSAASVSKPVMAMESQDDAVEEPAEHLGSRADCDMGSQEFPATMPVMQPVENRLTNGSQAGPNQPEPVIIPAFSGGMGDFLNGFI